MAPQAPQASKLMTAIRQSSLAAVINALDEGGDIEEGDIHGQRGLPLRTACFGGNLAVIEELIRRGANVNAAGSDGPCMPIRAALRARKPEIVALLLANGAQVPPEITLTPEMYTTPSTPPAPTVTAAHKQNIELPVLEFSAMANEAPRLPLEATPSPMADPNDLEFTLSEALPEALADTPPAHPPFIEEVNITSNYGVDTNLLTMDLLRFNDNPDDEPPPARDPKLDGGEKKSIFRRGGIRS